MRAMRLVGLLATAMLTIGTLITGWGTARAGRPAAGVRPDTGGPSPRDPRAEIFVQRGCSECHAIAALHVKAAADVGPDLTFAYADVVNRYGVSLDSFLWKPTGVMRLMLASHLHLGPMDRDSILQILRALYAEHRASMDEEIPSLPPGRALPRTRQDRIQHVQPRD